MITPKYPRVRELDGVQLWPAGWRHLRLLRSLYADEIITAEEYRAKARETIAAYRVPQAS